MTTSGDWTVYHTLALLGFIAVALGPFIVIAILKGVTRK